MDLKRPDKVKQGSLLPVIDQTTETGRTEAEFAHFQRETVFEHKLLLNTPVGV